MRIAFINVFGVRIFAIYEENFSGNLFVIKLLIIRLVLLINVNYLSLA